jgi:hypothetical protein
MHRYVSATVLAVLVAGQAAAADLPTRKAGL